MNNNPSSECLENLIKFEKIIGKDLVLKAINIGIDNDAKKWSYIRSIMRNFRNWGLNSLESWERHETQRKEEMKNQNNYSTYRPQQKQKVPNGPRKVEERTTTFVDDDMNILWKSVEQSKKENGEISHE